MWSTLRSVSSLARAFAASSPRGRRHHHADHRIDRGLDFSNYFIGLSKGVTQTNLADAKKQWRAYWLGQLPDPVTITS